MEHVEAHTPRACAHEDGARLGRKVLKAHRALHELTLHRGRGHHCALRDVPRYGQLLLRCCCCAAAAAIAAAVAAAAAAALLAHRKTLGECACKLLVLLLFERRRRLTLCGRLHGNGRRNLLLRGWNLHVKDASDGDTSGNLSAEAPAVGALHDDV
eukprot:6233439-Prymnesium_polylepis.2